MEQNQPWPQGQPKQEETSMQMQISEDAETAKGHYSHIFVTSYDKKFNHFRLDFYQESTPMPDSNKINRRLVGRIFLTKEGLTELGQVLSNLNKIIQAEQKKQLSEGQGTENRQ